MSLLRTIQCFFLFVCFTASSIKTKSLTESSPCLPTSLVSYPSISLLTFCTRLCWSCVFFCQSLVNSYFLFSSILPPTLLSFFPSFISFLHLSLLILFTEKLSLSFFTIPSLICSYIPTSLFSDGLSLF